MTYEAFFKRLAAMGAESRDSILLRHLLGNSWNVSHEVDFSEFELTKNLS